MMRALTSTAAFKEQRAVQALLKKSIIAAKSKFSLTAFSSSQSINQSNNSTNSPCLKVASLLLLNANPAASFRIPPDPARHQMLPKPLKQILTINSIVSHRTPKDQWTTHLNTSFPREKEIGLRSILEAMSG